MQPQLEKKNESLKVALVEVNRDKAIADETEKKVTEEATEVGKQKDEAKAIEEDAQKDLDEAKPALEEAERAVSSLEKSHITEIKNFANPPTGVKFVMQAVMVLLGQPKDWKSVKTYIMDTGGFLNQLLGFSKKIESVKDKTWKKVREEYLEKPEFNPAEVQKVNQAAANIAIWARACSKYAEVVKKVAPKKAKLAEVQKIVSEAEAKLSVKLAEVKKVKDQVAKLEADCKQMQDEKEALELEMETSRSRMARAEKLVVLLKDEGVRWADTVEVIKIQIEKLVGNVFISCACISYFGGFTGTYRVDLVNQWV